MTNDVIINTGGLKFDEGKNRLDLIDPKFIIGVGEVLTMGANKYGAWNWQGVTDFEDRYYAALLRHLLAWRSGEIYDKESGLHHLKHLATNVMFLLWKCENSEQEQSDHEIIYQCRKTLGLVK